MAWVAEAAARADGGGVSASDYGARACPELPGSKALLTSRPVGFYTCARLVAGTAAQPEDALVVWPFHLRRLASALDGGSKETSARAEAMQKQTTDMVQRVAALARRDADTGAGTGADGDLMVTVLWWKRPENSEADMISVHMCPMPQGATALVHGGGRRNAAFKHSQWVADRVPIEQHAREVEARLGTALQEVILSAPVESDAGEPDRALLEGSVSNFFVVKGESVVTAQSGVLSGSTRELVLTACGDLGIPVTFEAPRLSEHASWDAAFVTSSVRLVMEIETLVWETQDATAPSLRQVTFPSAKNGVPQRIRDHILSQRMYLPRP